MNNSNASQSPVISVNNLIKYYDNGLVKALNGLSFKIKQGESVAIMGPSGCGKSTLLNLMGTLDFPTKGEVRFNNKNILNYRPLHAFRAKYIGFVFQFHHLIPGLTLLENVELPMIPLNISKKIRQERAERILREMGLADRMNFLPTRVSGGERQRAAVSRALINNPEIILADEPTGNLDTVTGERVIHYILSHCRKEKKTVVIATHNPELTQKTDRLLNLKNGLLESEQKNNRK